MNLIQFLTENRDLRRRRHRWRQANLVTGATSVYALALEAADSGQSLRAAALAMDWAPRSIRAPSSRPAACCRRSIIPIRRTSMSPAPASPYLGSASTRDAMHKSNQQAAEALLTDSGEDVPHGP